MNRIWESVVHTAIAGAQRTPVPGPVLIRLGLADAGDVVGTAVQALAAANVLRKAASPLNTAPASGISPAPADDRQLCPPAAARVLMETLLRGTFPEVITEFFQLLRSSGKRLPPEAVPSVLDHFARKRILPDPAAAALGPLGPWLARQNPEWAPLFARPEADWTTGAFSERLQLLREAREAYPLVGLAWLESSWPQERPEHKIPFLEALRVGLSLTDEPLLDQAAADKNNGVRRLAYRLLLQLPESQLSRTAFTLLPKPGTRKAKKEAISSLLNNIIPEEGPFARMALRALLPAPESGKAVAGAILQLLPPEMLLRVGGLPADEFITAIDAEKDAENLLSAWLENVAWRRDPEAMAATIRYFDQRPGHPLWTSKTLQTILSALPAPLQDEVLPALCRHDQLLESPNSALVQALLETGHTWPETLLRAIVTFPLRSGRPRHWQPPAPLRQLLHHAACCCRPEEAESIAPADGEWPYPWQSELMQFWSIVRFRRQLHQFFKEVSG